MRRQIVKIGMVAILLSSFFTTPVKAQTLERESNVWGHIFAGTSNVKTYNATVSGGAHLEAKSKFEVTYLNFPVWAQSEMQSAIDVWAGHFYSNVPIKVEATWGRSAVYGLLGSARPGKYFSNFANVPDATLWYPAALANALAKRDLDKQNPEIVIQVNSLAEWNTRNDGNPTSTEYDLQSVFIHEIGHGLGFLSTDSYDSFFGYGSIEQPTPFDAYLQLDDGRRLSDLPSPSIELGKALTSNLNWSGLNGIAANGGVKPKIFTPNRYESGSSISHLDESTFSQTGVNSLMTPNLDAGEIFREPGSLILAMMDDMRLKPPAGIAQGIPNQVRNLQVLISDSSAIITFDPPTNVRSAQVTNYAIKNLKTGLTSYSNSSPANIKDLKNGVAYTFSVSALNSNGSSEPLISESVTPTTTWKSTVIDGASDARYVVSNTLNHKPFIAYISSKTGTLRTATYLNGVWKKIVVDGLGGNSGRTNHKLGSHLSICSTGTGQRQVIHLFYGDIVDNDLRHATITDTSYSFEVVDGNASAVQPYDQFPRVKTGSDVSYSSACVANTTTLQVFYRDESQGVLLGAVKKSNKWNYELIDGDRKTNGRTTGDVAFHLKAYISGATTYLIYDSVLVVNQKKDTTSGEIRLASRDGALQNTWIYETLESPSNSASVLGYDVALNKVGSKIIASWLVATGATLPNPSSIRVFVINGETSTYTSTKFGTPSAPLNLFGSSLTVGCQKRLCALDTISKRISLISGWQSDDPIQNGWITLNGVRYLVAGIDGQLVSLKSI